MSYGSKNGCPGWIRTSTVPFNRRTDYCYPTEHKRPLGGASSVEPFLQRLGFPTRARRARPSSSASIKNGHRGRTCTCGHLVPGQACCSYTTRCCPGLLGKEAGVLFLCGRRGLAAPWNRRRVGDWRTRRELHPQPSRRQRGALLLSYESENGGKCW